MDIEDKLNPLRFGGELLLDRASEALANGEYERGRELVLKAIRQGLIVRLIKETKQFSAKEIERIMQAEPAELYQIFAEEEGQEYPINSLNYTHIRHTLEKLI